MLRVIAGEYKGRKLLAPKGLSCRPTLDRVKESIFNVLGADIIDRNVLDLFCGSGSLGIEALSRGAATVAFIDFDKEALEITRRNLSTLGLEKKATCILADVMKIGGRIREAKFDLIFIDPPYENQYGSQIIKLLLDYAILAEAGLLVLEHSRHEEIVYEPLKLLKQLKFGQTEVDFYFRPDKA
jgi:16S rRNA (guanine966-N2)-methyltransferase